MEEQEQWNTIPVLLIFFFFEFEFPSFCQPPIFLKYISDAFKEVYDELKKDKLSDPEDVDEYKSKNIFRVPPEARGDYFGGEL